MNYRPGGSAQYILAISNFEQGTDTPRRFRMGFMSSSDNHYARPGTGFKEKNRPGNTESNTRRSADSLIGRVFIAQPEEPTAFAVYEIHGAAVALAYTGTEVSSNVTVARCSRNGVDAGDTMGE